MRKNQSHSTKSQKEKDYYTRIIKKQDYEPTVDDALKFAETDDYKQDFSISQSTQKRKSPITQQIIQHFEENWIKWLGGLIGAILIWLMVDSKITISGLVIKIDGVKDDVKELKQNDKEMNERIRQQELLIKENQFKINSFENNFYFKTFINNENKLNK